MMKYFLIIVLSLFSVFVIKILMRAGLSSVKGLEYEPIIPFMDQIRTVFGHLKIRWLIVAAVNMFCCLILAGYYHADMINIINILLLLSVLWACAAYDIRYEIIPNSILIAGVAARIVLLGIQILMSPQDFAYYAVNAFGACIALLITGEICRLVSRESVGMGDIKLLAMIGLFLGVDSSFYTVMASILVLFVLSVFLLITKKADRNTAIPFAPFLLVGLILSTVGYGVY